MLKLDGGDPDPDPPTFTLTFPHAQSSSRDKIGAPVMIFIMLELSGECWMTVDKISQACCEALRIFSFSSLVES